MNRMDKEELLDIFGELTKNVGLGIFINGVYGISDATIELFNILDIIFGMGLMVMGIIAERRKR